MPPPARSPAPVCDWTSGSANAAHGGTQRFSQVGDLITGNACDGRPIYPDFPCDVMASWRRGVTAAPARPGERGHRPLAFAHHQAAALAGRVASSSHDVGEPKPLDELLDEEDVRIRAERGGNRMEQALTPHLQDLAARLQKTLAQYQEEDGTPPRPRP